MKPTKQITTGHQAEPEGRVRQAGGDVVRHVGLLARVRARALPEGAVRSVIGRQRIQRLFSPGLLVVRFFLRVTVGVVEADTAAVRYA